MLHTRTRGVCPDLDKKNSNLVRCQMGVRIHDMHRVFLHLLGRQWFLVVFGRHRSIGPAELGAAGRAGLAEREPRHVNGLQ